MRMQNIGNRFPATKRYFDNQACLTNVGMISVSGQLTGRTPPVSTPPKRSGASCPRLSRRRSTSRSLTWYVSPVISSGAACNRQATSKAVSMEAGAERSRDGLYGTDDEGDGLATVQKLTIRRTRASHRVISSKTPMPSDTLSSRDTRSCSVSRSPRYVLPLQISEV